jgi:hypothetical protein
LIEKVTAHNGHDHLHRDGRNLGGPRQRFREGRTVFGRVGHGDSTTGKVRNWPIYPLLEWVSTNRQPRCPPSV